MPVMHFLHLIHSVGPVVVWCAVSRGRELLGELSSGVDSSLSYAERAVAHVAKGLLELAAPDGSQQDRSDAKQQLSKALKLAHGRLQNHQLVSQVLLFMTPLQVSKWAGSGHRASHDPPPVVC